LWTAELSGYADLNPNGLQNFTRCRLGFSSGYLRMSIASRGASTPKGISKKGDGKYLLVLWISGFNRRLL
jgi:hypothetical protein